MKRHSIIAAVVLLSACAVPPPERPATIDPPAPATTRSVESPGPVAEVKIGVSLSLSGPLAAVGLEIKEAIDLAAGEVNEDGGPRRRRFRFVYADDKSRPHEVNVPIQALIETEHVPALLGGATSDLGYLGGRVANRAGVPMISTFATDPHVTRAGPFAFRACVSAERQARAAARFMTRDQGGRRIGLMSANDSAQSAYLARVFQNEMEALGVGIATEQRWSSSDADERRRILVAIKKAKPDFVYAPVSPEMMISVARDASAIGLPGRLFVGAEGWGAEALLRDGGAGMEGAYFTEHWAVDAPWPRARAFAEAYRRRYHRDPSSVAATAYDAAMLLADAIRRAKGDTPDSIREAIQDTRGFEGATGVINIDAFRGADKDVLVLRIIHGKPAYFATVKMSGRDG